MSIFRKVKGFNVKWLMALLLFSIVSPALFAQQETTLADQLFQKGVDYSKKAKYDSALTEFQKASNIFENAAKQTDSLQFWDKYLQCQNRIGKTQRIKGNYDRSRGVLQKALDFGMKKLGKTHLTVAESIYGLGFTYGEKGQFEEMKKFSQWALTIRRKILGENDLLTAKSYSTVAMSLDNLGKNEAAMKYHQKALAIRQKIFGDNHLLVANSLNNVGISFSLRGDYDQGLVYFNKALEIWLRVLGEKHPRVADVYGNLGAIYKIKGDYENALKAYQKVLSIYSATYGAVHPRIARVYHNMGNIYREMHRTDAALEYYQKAVNLLLQTTGETHPETAWLYHDMGVAYKSTNDYENARTYLNKALSLRLQLLGKRHAFVAETYQQLGELSEVQNNFPEALRYYQKAICVLSDDFDDQDFHRNPPFTVIDIIPDAIQSIASKAQALAKLAGTDTPLKEKHTLLKESLSTFQLAAQVLKKVRGGFRAEGSKLFLTEASADIFDVAIETALNLYDISGDEQYKHTAFQLIEQCKTAVLQDALKESRARQFSAIPDSLLDKERALRVDIARFETRLDREIEKKDGERNRERINELQNRLFSVNQEYEQLTDRFENEYPRYFHLKYRSDAATVEKLQKALDDNTAILEYLIGKTSLYMAVVSKNSFEIISTPIDSTFRATANRFVKSLRFVDKTDYLKSAVTLYKKLIYPVENRLAGKNNLVIIPGDVLHYVPFEALISENKPGVELSQMDYLIRRFAISYHYSAALFLETRQAAGTNPPLDFLGFAPVFSDKSKSKIVQAGVLNWISALFQNDTITADNTTYNPLKYSEEEVHKIIKMFTQTSKKSAGYFHSDATETQFKKNAGSAKFLHIATHGALDEEKPALSGLIFAEPGDSSAADDSILYAAEVYNLELNADLVVLGSCESGIGKLVKGEGVMALTRGFLYAGAKNIIHSLWKVNDKHTSRLMIDLYRQILAGKSYTEALRRAKLNLIQHEETAFPNSWSSFVLIGF